MTKNLNRLEQSIGDKVIEWAEPDYPSHELLVGDFCRIEPLNIKLHAQALFDALKEDAPGRMWTYLPYGPFNSFDEYNDILKNLTQQSGQQFYAIVDQTTKRALGVAAYLRINPTAGSIEIGHLSYSPLLQRTTIATEAMYLMMKKIFELGYRRYEWKCNSLNEPSINSALRLGFKFEGIFRQSNVIKGRNRDTAWYSIINSEWSTLELIFEKWLSKSNFDENGQQRTVLNSRL